MEQIIRLSTMIIDDNEHSRESLRVMIEKVFGGVLHISGLASNVQEAIVMNEQIKPDLVFLDIEMPDGTGFDFLEQSTHRDFKLIITSGHESYALKAFRYNADDYLLKPFSLEELRNAVNKAIESPVYRKSGPEFRMLLDYMNGNRSKIALPAAGGIEFVEVAQIIRCEADGNYSKIMLRNGQIFIVAKTLKIYEELLRPDGFVRIHAAHLVNLKEIKSYQRGEGGQVTLNDGTFLEVSRSRKEAFLGMMRG
jgi:two-component system LytT family response regulator